MNKQLTENQCYGAMMQALPCHAVILLAMPDVDILKRMSKFIGRVPPKSEKALENWVAKSINKKVNDSSQLADLGELAALDGIGKKLKKLAKKAVEPIKKLAVDPLKKVFKKLEDSNTVKKIARPLAYAAGVVTGTVGIVAAADQARNAAVAAKQQSKINNQVYDVQQAQIDAALQTAQNDNLPVSYPQGQAQQSFASSNQLAPQQPTYSSVQRLAQEEEQPKVVGLNTQAIMDNIKQNPIPWALGGFGVLWLITRNNQPRGVAA